MDTKELKQLAADIVENKVFGTFHMGKDHMGSMNSVFLPLVFMEEKDKQEMSDNKIVHLYEYHSEATSFAVNGWPCFLSFRQISKDDWTKLIEYMKEYEEKVKTFLDEDSVEQKILKEQPDDNS